MYFFVLQWVILSKFACFAMEGSHRRLKCLLRNSGGLSLLRGIMAPQVVVDNHTIDDNLRREGWNPTNRIIRGQGPLPPPPPHANGPPMPMPPPPSRKKKHGPPC